MKNKLENLRTEDINLQDIKQRALLYKSKNGSHKDEDDIGEVFKENINVTYKVKPTGKVEVIDERNNKLDDIDLTNVIDSILGIKSFSSNKVKRYEEIIKTFPDLELAGDILVSSILSPNLLSTVEFRQQLNSGWVPNSISTNIINTISNEIKYTYDLNNEGNDMVMKALVKDGAYCKIIMGDKTLESYIGTTFKHLTTESLDGNEEVIDTIMLNDYGTKRCGDLVSFSDNKSILALTKIKLDHMEKDMTTLAHDKDKNKDKIEHFFKTVNSNKEVSYRTLKEASKSIDYDSSRPLTIEVPMESVVPIHLKSDPENHLGYFLLLDEDGFPIKASDEDVDMVHFDEDVANDVATGEILTSDEYNNRKNRFKNGNKKHDVPILKDKGISQEILSNTVREYLADKGLSKQINRKLANMLYKIIFARANKSLKTNVLFIPKNDMFYMAFNYHPNGVGKSILDDMTDLANDRMAIMTAKLHAQIKNLIPDTIYNIKIDDDNQDPQSALKQAIITIMELNGTVLPNMNGSLDRDSFGKWAQRLGMSFKVENEKLPNYSIDKDIRYHKYDLPDDDIEEEIKGKMYMKYSLTKDMVTKGMDGELAVRVRLNNALFTKRIIQYQLEIERYLTRYIRMLLSKDAILYNKTYNNIANSYDVLNKSFTEDNRRYLKENHITKDEIIDFIMEDVKQNYKLELIRPEDETQENLDDTYNDYVDFVNSFLEERLSEDVLPQKFLDIFDGNIEKLKKFTANRMIEKWMSENNYHTELLELFRDTEDGENNMEVFASYNEYAKGIIGSFDKYRKELTSRESFYKEIDDGYGKDEDKLPIESVTDMKDENKDPTTLSYKVGSKAQAYEDSFNELHTEAFTTEDILTTKVDVSPKELMQLQIELNSSSLKRLFSLVNQNKKINRYHARAICDVLYEEIHDYTLDSMVSTMKYLRDQGYLNDFIRTIAKQYYANKLSSTIFMSKNLGVSPNVRDIMNTAVYESVDGKFDSTNSLYISYVDLNLVAKEIKNVVNKIVSGQYLNTIDNGIELDNRKSGYLDIRDPNNIYFIGERYSVIEHSDNIEALYHIVDYDKTILLHDLYKVGKKDRINDLYNIDIDDYDINTLVIIDDMLVDLLSTSNLDWLPLQDGKVVNPLHSQRLRLMKRNYDTSIREDYLEVEDMDIFMSKEYVLENSKGIIPLNSMNPNTTLTIDEIKNLIFTTKKLNISLLIYYALTKERLNSENFTHVMLEELRTIYSKALVKEKNVENYFSYSPLEITKDSTNMNWSNPDVIESIFTTETYSNVDLVEDSKLVNIVKENLTKDVDKKITYIKEVLDTKGYIIDNYGDKLTKEHFYSKDGTFKEELASVVSIDKN